MKTAVTIENVTVSFGSKTVLEDISLEVGMGEFWGIIGPNGGGKTTLLRSILGLVKPQKGVIKVFGLSPQEAVRKKWVAYLPQKIENELPFSSYDLLSFVCSNKRKVEELLEFVGMKEKALIPFKKLSGGEKQRTLIAMNLAVDPRLLLLDEPNTGVDIVAQDVFYEILRRLKDKKKITIIMVSHGVGVVVNFVDKIACLNRKLHYAGDPRGSLDCRLLETLYGMPVEVFVHHPECKGCHIYRIS